MGDQCRLKLGLWLWLGLVAALAAVSCKSAEDEQKRRLLETEQRMRERNERIEARRILGPQGELLPSQTKIAGVVLPRGFEMKFVEPHQWTYDGHFPEAKVQAYLESRLYTKTRTEKPLGEVEYLGVKEKSDPNMVAVLVRVSPVPAKPEWTRIYIGDPVPIDPNMKIPTPEEEAALAAKRRLTVR